MPITNVDNYGKLPADFAETMKLQQPKQSWSDTLDNCVTTAAYIIGGLSVAAAAGYGLYKAGYSVGAREIGDFCEKRLTHLAQTGIDIGVKSTSLFDRLADGATTAFGLYVAKDYVPAIACGILATAIPFTISANRSKVTKVIGTMGLLAVAGYGMYFLGHKTGVDLTTKMCEAGITALKNKGLQVIAGGAPSLEGPISTALVPFSNSSALLAQGSALSIPFTGFNGAFSDYIYQTAMENMPPPDPSILWESAKEFANEKYDNLYLTLKVVGGAIVTPYIIPPLFAAAKLGARCVRFIAYRR